MQHAWMRHPYILIRKSRRNKSLKTHITGDRMIILKRISGCENVYLMSRRTGTNDGLFREINVRKYKQLNAWKRKCGRTPRGTARVPPLQETFQTPVFTSQLAQQEILLISNNQLSSSCPINAIYMATNLTQTDSSIASSPAQVLASWWLFA